MASRTPRPAAGTNGRRPTLDATLVAARTDQVEAAAHAIARISGDVSEGADSQIRSLDGTLSGLNEMVASLKETAGQADSVAASAEELLSSVNEMAASIEQVTANTVSLAASVGETSTSIVQTSASMRQIGGATEDLSSS